MVQTSFFSINHPPQSRHLPAKLPPRRRPQRENGRFWRRVVRRCRAVPYAGDAVATSGVFRRWLGMILLVWGRWFILLWRGVIRMGMCLMRRLTSFMRSVVSGCGWCWLGGRGYGVLASDSAQGVYDWLVAVQRTRSFICYTWYHFRAFHQVISSRSTSMRITCTDKLVHNSISYASDHARACYMPNETELTPSPPGTWDV